MNGLLLDSDELRAAGRHLGEFLAAYQEGIASRPVFPVLDRAVIRRLLDEPLPAEGRSIEELFAELGADIIANSTQIAHPRFLAYVLASSTGVAPFAEAAAAALNQNCNLWTLSPAANAIEQKVISWFSELFAIQGGGGIITSGGSMANLSALVAARDSREPVVSRSEGLQGGGAPIVLYTSEEAHNSIDKAAALVGLGLNNVVRIPTDDRFRIRLDLLREAVAADRSAGRVSFCVVATAGTITTGAIDPLEELVAYCGEERLWLHVDGAYGAFAVFSSRVRDQLVAAGQADSLTLDPHKLLFMPLEAGCVLFRDPESWQDVFSFPSTYLSMPEEPDLLVQGPQDLVELASLRDQRLHDGHRWGSRPRRVHGRARRSTTDSGAPGAGDPHGGLFPRSQSGRCTQRGGAEGSPPRRPGLSRTRPSRRTRMPTSLLHESEDDSGRRRCHRRGGQSHRCGARVMSGLRRHASGRLPVPLRPLHATVSDSDLED